MANKNEMGTKMDADTLTILLSDQLRTLTAGRCSRETLMEANAVSKTAGNLLKQAQFELLYAERARIPIPYISILASKK